MPMPSRKKRPRDPIELAKLIGDIATGQVEDREGEGKHPPYVRRGKLGGAKGGPARSAALTPEQRSEIAKIAANARWKKSREREQE